jgi:thiamine kinase
MIADAVAAALGVDRSRVEVVAPLPSGSTNASHRVRIGHDDFVVRVGCDAPERLGIDRHSECSALRAAEALGLGPELVFSDPDTGFLITRYLRGPAWSAKDLADHANLERLGGWFAQLHSSARPIGLREIQLQAYVESFEVRVVRRDRAKLRSTAKAFLQARVAGPQAFCHNDVHAGNVFDANPLRLIDWEYAAWSDPQFDLAAPICYHRMDESARESLLEGYRASGRTVGVADLAQACWLFDYVAVLWQLVHSADTPRDLPSGMRVSPEARLAELARSVRGRPKAIFWWD